MDYAINTSVVVGAVVLLVPLGIYVIKQALSLRRR